MKKIRYSITLILLLMLNIFADEGLFGDLFSPALGYEEPHVDYIEPLPPFMDGSYRHIVYKNLIGKPKHTSSTSIISRGLWVIKHPSFTPESSLILECISEFDQPVTNFCRKAITEKWILKVNESDSKMFGEEGVKIPQKITTHQIEVDREFCKTIQIAFGAALRTTRYPPIKEKLRWVIMDGIRYEFYNNFSYEYYGFTHSPEKGVPAQLTELAEEMFKLVLNPDKKDELIIKCDSLAREIIKNTNEHEFANQHMDFTVKTPVE